MRPAQQVAGAAPRPEPPTFRCNNRTCGHIKPADWRERRAQEMS